MQRSLSPTLAVILAAGLAVGIGLTRPASLEGPQTYPAADQTPIDDPAGTPTDRDPDGSSRRGNRPANARGGQAAALDRGVITIEDFAFDGPAAVPAGAALQVINADAVAHTLTFESSETDTGTLDGGSGAALLAPSSPGTHAYFCRIHPAMRGRLEVTG